jgi:hypothetical protein
MTDVPFHRWYEAIAQRRSRRRYNGLPIRPETMAALRQMCLVFRPFPEARVELVVGSADEVFKGILGAYGKVLGAPAFLAFVGDMESPSVQESLGYTGEGIILEAVSLGLSTCWVTGMFRPAAAARIAGIRSTEKVLAVSPVGYAVPSSPPAEKLLTGFGRAHKRRPLSEMVTGLTEKDWPKWARSALEAAQLAPSAYNRQPWRFEIGPDSVVISVDKTVDIGPSRRLECGMAMLHIEVGAMERGRPGKWETLSSPRVARFTVQSMFTPKVD